MAITFPTDLDFLAKCLTGPSVPLTLQRYDERSGSGDGRMWSTQLAPPLWTATYGLYARTMALAREVNAKVNAMDGMARTMLWSDPFYSGPASGMTDGLGAVQTAGVRSDRGAVGLTGLPAGFVLSAGDFISIQHAGGRVYFGQFAEGGKASQAGNLGQRELRPYLPQGIGAGVSVELVRPYFRAAVVDFTPFANVRGHWGDNASISIIQRP